jgi:hypothetical protein
VDHLNQHLTNASTEPESLPFDPDEVRRRYNHERDIRVQRRPEGKAQYVHIKDLAEHDGRFAKMLSDPWCKVPDRKPKTDTVEVCIVGSGYGGLW